MNACKKPLDFQWTMNVVCRLKDYLQHRTANIGWGGSLASGFSSIINELKPSIVAQDSKNSDEDWIVNTTKVRNFNCIYRAFLTIRHASGNGLPAKTVKSTTFMAVETFSTKHNQKAFMVNCAFVKYILIFLVGHNRALQTGKRHDYIASYQRPKQAISLAEIWRHIANLAAYGTICQHVTNQGPFSIWEVVTIGSFSSYSTDAKIDMGSQRAHQVASVASSQQTH